MIERFRFSITDIDTNYLYVYVPDNRYAEPIFIYCYKVNKLQSEVSPFFALVFPRLSHLNNKKIKDRSHINFILNYSFSRFISC